MLRSVLAGALAAILAIGSVQAEPLPKGFKADSYNGSVAPVTEGGVTTFTIFYGECSDKTYEDDRGESDCLNGNVRSAMGQSGDIKVGNAVEYRFDFQIDPGFAYPGYQNPHAVGFHPDGWDSRLRIASWEGELLHNVIYLLKVDAKHGVNFLARTCQSPDKFGEWVSFSMKVRWTADQKGWIKVSCDDRVIYADEGIATDQAPHCLITNVCEPDIVKHPREIHLTLGPVHAGFGYEWKKHGKATPFTEIQEDGITVRMRNVSIANDAILYEDADKAIIRKLQERLIALGCDPGPADGANGNRTREAALTCRRFGEGVLPPKLTVATASQFLELYTGEGVEALPLGGLQLPEPTSVVKVSEIQSTKQGRDVNVQSFMRIAAPEFDGNLDFGMTGLYAYPLDNFASLNITLDVDLSDVPADKVRKCNVKVETLKLGGNKTEVDVTRMTLRMARDDSALRFATADCLLEALPNGARVKVDFLLTHFRDIAIAIMSGRQAEEFKHEGVTRFFERVALGEITLGI